MKYVVIIPELWHSKHTIEANSKQEAFDEIQRQIQADEYGVDTDVCCGDLEFVQVIQNHSWNIEEVKE